MEVEVVAVVDVEAEAEAEAEAEVEKFLKLFKFQRGLAKTDSRKL
jgi:hypothetical protein